MAHLKIYKASAGSGKTYKLTEEYLRLLFKNQNNYRRTLGVTFTNKATEEMKIRIVSELYKLSTGINSDFQETFSKELKISHPQIQTLAKQILNLILHNYSKFSISTIDSFFQNIIKAFAKEIGLYSGYIIELDHEPVITEAIDNMMVEIDNNIDLRNWLSNFIYYKIQDGKSWNINKNISDLSSQIFKEKYQENEIHLKEKIADKDFMKQYLANLKSIATRFENNLQNIAIIGLEIITRHKLSVEDYKGGSRGFMTVLNRYAVANFTVPNATLRNAIHNVENWYTAKSEEKEKIINSYNNSLNETLNELVSFYDANYRKYYTASAIIKNIYSLGLINDIAIRVRAITDEQNIFLLSDAAKLLQSIINNDDTPFIYEKTGQYFHHFMIDEFQDTSGFQWNNFKPLINNSLAENNYSLIVGDVKQSIYRWRNSDWKLLAEQADRDFKQFGTYHIELDTNWRSKSNVIKYNNSIFSVASGLLQNEFNNNIPEDISDEIPDLQNKILQAYQTVLQNFPAKEDNKGGIIQNHFLHNKNKDWKEQSLNKIPGIIENLQEKGLKAKDITLLVRKKDEGQLIADHLLAYKNSLKAKEGINYDFISNDALYINSSKAVQFIINVLSSFVFPDDQINKAQILYYYRTYGKPDSKLSLNEIFISVARNPEYFNEQIPADFVKSMDVLSKLSLYEFIESIIHHFGLNKIPDETAYLIGLQNLIQQYSNKNSSDLQSFLDWWEENGDKHTLTISEDTDAIKIITIHKSKGLEFKAVIIPFFDWKLDNAVPGEIIWCKPDTEPFNKLNIVPVNYSSSLGKTIFYKDYFNEKLHCFIDSINLMYVAFTRAKDVLVTLSPETDTSKGIKTIAGLLSETIKLRNSDSRLFNLPDYFDPDSNFLEIASDELLPKNLIRLNQLNIERYNTSLRTQNIKVKLHSTDFFGQEHGSPQVKGIILHELFAGIKNKNEISKKIETAVLTGKIDQTEKENLEKHIGLAFNDPKISAWFSGNYDILNEKTILLPGNTSKRPDRIMIKEKNVIVVDYKFGQEYDKYYKQVKEYCDILKTMGYEPKGYVWYLLSNKIVEV